MHFINLTIKLISSSLQKKIITKLHNITNIYDN